MKLNIVLPVLIVILLGVVLSNVSSKNDISQLSKEIAQTEVDFDEIASVRDKWKISALRKKQLETLFNGNDVKDKVEYKKSSGTEFKVKLKGISQESLKKITKRLLENTYEIKALEVVKIDEYTADLEVRVAY